MDDATARRRIEQLELIEKLREEQGDINFNDRGACYYVIYHGSNGAWTWCICPRSNFAVYNDYLVFTTQEKTDYVVKTYKDVLYKLHPAYLQHGVNVYA